MTRPPAAIGMPVDRIDTPALVVDLDAYTRNLDHMARFVGGQRVRLRPHAKTHKCPVVALDQIARGAVGVCCQKVSEAEAMVEGGVERPGEQRDRRGRRSPGSSSSPRGEVAVRGRARNVRDSPGRPATSGSGCRSSSR
jgi:hypothetical protein